MSNPKPDLPYKSATAYEINKTPTAKPVNSGWSITKSFIDFKNFFTMLYSFLCVFNLNDLVKYYLSFKDLLDSLPSFSSRLFTNAGVATIAKKVFLDGMKYPTVITRIHVIKNG